MVKKHVTRSLSVVLEDIRVQATLALLDGPYRCARLLGKSLWDFSRTIDELHKTGVSDDQLDFLVAADLLERKVELSRPARNGTSRSHATKARQVPMVWFVLTKQGAEVASNSAAVEATSETGNRSKEEGTDLLPSWDGRVFSYDGAVLKMFRRHAPAQERILDAFQQAGWPEWLADPLERRGEEHSVKHLRDEVRLLNRTQKPWRVRFDTDPQWLGVRWTVVATPE